MSQTVLREGGRNVREGRESKAQKAAPWTCNVCLRVPLQGCVTTETSPPDDRDAAEASPPESDAGIVERVRRGDVEGFAALMRKHNRRLFRIVRGVVGDDAEAEDVCQETWLRAYTRLDTLRDPHSFGRWLGRIGFRRALERRSSGSDSDVVEEVDALQADDDPPERQVQRRQIAAMVEKAIDQLPPSLRTVFLLRDVEQATTAETAEILGLTDQNVRVRLHRARAHLREELVGELAQGVADAFRFENERCDRLVAAVLPRLHTMSDRT